MKIEIITKSTDETLAFAEKLGQSSKPGSVYALCGELGTGKTIIAKGIASGLGISEEITSPTFNLMEMYSSKIPMYHFDLYRIEVGEEFDHLNFEQFWESEGISVIEWAEKAKDRLPKNTIFIFLEYVDANTRRIGIEYTNN